MTAPADLPAVIERLARVPRCPRYAFVVLNLIVSAAGEGASSGPYVAEAGRAVHLRDRLCDALAPMAGRDPKRLALAEQVRAELEAAGALPADPADAARAVDEAVYTLTPETMRARAGVRSA